MPKSSTATTWNLVSTVVVLVLLTVIALVSVSGTPDVWRAVTVQFLGCMLMAYGYKIGHYDGKRTTLMIGVRVALGMFEALLSRCKDRAEARQLYEKHVATIDMDEVRKHCDDSGFLRGL